MGLGKDGLSNSAGDVVPNVNSPLQGGGPLLPRGADTDMLIKVSLLFSSKSIKLLFGVFMFLFLKTRNFQWMRYDIKIIVTSL